MRECVSCMHACMYVYMHRLMTLKRMRQSQKHALSDYYSHVNHRCQHNGKQERNLHDEQAKHTHTHTLEHYIHILA